MEDRAKHLVRLLVPVIRHRAFIIGAVVWYTLIELVGVLPLMAQHTPEFTDKLDNALAAARVACGFMIIAHGMRNTYFTTLAIMSACTTLINTIALAIILGHELVTCQKLYNAEQEFASIVSSIGPSASTDVIQATVTSSLTLTPFGFACLGLLHTGSDYRLQLTTLVMVALINTLFPLALIIGTLLNVPSIKAYAAAAEAAMHDLITKHTHKHE